ncbi:hypothetical protein [Bradyrhizobium sp. CCBAU 53380]|uniref:hypothetical protein n=1 Tax=Bradyrhizobium sp. CCBAU 53380 TaxID=1325117 RepID=UPI0023020D8A|nr:hypothetical protein [Bradyrhizobium sp. CCBAU 53380]
MKRILFLSAANVLAPQKDERQRLRQKPSFLLAQMMLAPSWDREKTLANDRKN